MTHLLVTNDFPPKVGGIQSYLWELWRRLPPERVVVVTSSYPGDAAFDARQPFRVIRAPDRVLLPRPKLARRLRALASEVGAGLVMLDPALPLGMLGPHMGVPYGVVLHGAEVAVPGRLPVARTLLARVLEGASPVVAAGRYPALEAERYAGRARSIITVPPGVDLARFRPLDAAEKAAARVAAGLPADGCLVVGLSRLVPRKGFDMLVRAAARLAPGRADLVVAIGGSGRDRGRLQRLALSVAAPVRFLGPVPDDRLAPLMGAADVFAVPCRNRWGGLEQEGFGMVFLEAAACGVPQVAGRSGGAADAVVDGETGAVVSDPSDVAAVTAALARLLDDPDLRRAQGGAARRRAERLYDWDVLAASLDSALAPLG
ncbi:MAG: glycosyltransferase family 1 protein [Acidimicrobiales bacterium]|nr:MAG: glycosyltransferase family 1 protein [Acidimicrobiales bacterium]